MVPLFLVVPFVLAQASPPTVKIDTAARARVVAPFLDPATVAVGRVDVTRLDADALLRDLTGWSPQQLKENADTQAAIRKWITDFTSAGGRELYAVVSLADLPGTPFFLVAPVETGANAKALAAALTVGGELTEAAEPIGAAVVAGKKNTLARLRNLKPEARPELARAFDHAGDTTAQLLLLPPAHARRMLEETYPTLPNELGGGSIKTLTRGLQWAALGLEVKPQFSLRGVIQAEDAKAAQALADYRRSIIGLLLTAPISKGRETTQLAAFLEHLKPTVIRDQLLVKIDGDQLSNTVRPFVQDAIDVAQRGQQMNNLKMLGLALHNHHDDKGSLPAVANFDKQGKPLLSWRVHLLPYLNQEDLYKEFNLDEPWDSPQNKKLIEKMPTLFRNRVSKAGKGMTTLVAPVHASFIFSGTPKGSKMLDIHDGTSNTILLVDVTDEHAVIWTKPDDWKPDKANPLKGLRVYRGGVFATLFADGSVRFPSKDVDGKTLWAVFTHSGGEVANLP